MIVHSTLAYRIQNEEKGKVTNRALAMHSTLLLHANVLYVQHM